MKRLEMLSSFISQSSKRIHISHHGSIGIISMQSFQDKNLLTMKMADQLCDCLQKLKLDQKTNVIMIKSSVPNIFSIGGDINEYKDPQKLYQTQINQQNTQKLTRSINSIRKPIIAAVNGKAIGAGFIIALLCDIVLTNINSSFCLPQIKIGIITCGGGFIKLTNLIKQNQAMRYLLTGEVITGKQAINYNIAQQLNSLNFDQNAIQFAKKISQKALTTAIITKRAIKQSQNMTMNQGLDYQRDIIYSLLNTKAAKQGISAFCNKKKPNFRGL